MVVGLVWLALRHQAVADLAVVPPCHQAVGTVSLPPLIRPHTVITPGRPVVIGLREHVHVTLEAISRCRLHGRVRATADGTGHLELDQAIF